jgi:predicted metal-dependent hydrolase
LDRRTKKELLGRLEVDALRICGRFRLRYRVLEAERANVKSRYGVCFSDGTIRIRLRHATSGNPLKYSSLVNTLCHELAHLRHFNHGPGFQNLYAEILGWARRENIYQPRRLKTTAERIDTGTIVPFVKGQEAVRLPVDESVNAATDKAASMGQLELFE